MLHFAATASDSATQTAVLLSFVSNRREKVRVGCERFDGVDALVIELMRLVVAKSLLQLNLMNSRGLIRSTRFVIALSLTEQVMRALTRSDIN